MMFFCFLHSMSTIALWYGATLFALGTSILSAAGKREKE